jgi:hypothetical protein
MIEGMIEGTKEGTIKGMTEEMTEGMTEGTTEELMTGKTRNIAEAGQEAEIIEERNSYN